MCSDEDRRSNVWVLLYNTQSNVNNLNWTFKVPEQGSQKKAKHRLSPKMGPPNNPETLANRPLWSDRSAQARYPWLLAIGSIPLESSAVLQSWSHTTLSTTNRILILATKLISRWREICSSVQKAGFGMHSVALTVSKTTKVRNVLTWFNRNILVPRRFKWVA